MDVYNIRNRRVEVPGAADQAAPHFVPESSADSDTFARLRAHSRKYERQSVDYPVSIRLVSTEGSELDRGTARIRDMTPEGAFIGELALDKGALPIESFHLCFRVEEGELRGVEGSCRPVRISGGSLAGFGVKFREVYVKIMSEGDDSIQETSR